MSEVKRFFPELAFHVMSENCKAYSAVMTESESGGWVEGHEYDRLRARVAEIESLLSKADADICYWHGKWKELKDQDPVAVVTGVYAGRTVVMPLDGSTVLPARMALFRSPVVKESLTTSVNLVPFSMPDAAVNRIYDAAGRAYRRFKSSVRGQMVTKADAYEWHIINATLDELRAMLSAAKAQEGK